MKPILGLPDCERMGMVKRIIDPTVKPVIDPARRVPVALRVKVEEELDRMQQIGVIEPVEQPTEWVSSMVTIVKPNKLRICIDPRRLNEAVLREHYPLLTVEEVVSRIPGAKYFSTFGKFRLMKPQVV